MIRARAALVVLCLGSCPMVPADATAWDETGFGVASPDTLPEAQASGSALASPAYRFPSGREQLKDWALNAFGPSALAGSVVSAAWGQWVTDEPPEWPDDGRGFARASASRRPRPPSPRPRSRSSRPRRGWTPATIAAPARVSATSHPCAQDDVHGAQAGRERGVLGGQDGVAVRGPAGDAHHPLSGSLHLRDGALSGAYAVLMNAGWNLAREFVLKAPAW